MKTYTVRVQVWIRYVDGEDRYPDTVKVEAKNVAEAADLAIQEIYSRKRGVEHVEVKEVS